MNLRSPTSHRWLATSGATVLSTYALDAGATLSGVALAATGLGGVLPHAGVLALLAASYVAWGVGLRRSLAANWSLLQRTGASTNLLSKAAHDVAGSRQLGERARRLAAAGGYLAVELVKEAPYYAGAFGAAALSSSVSSGDALVFLAGTNLGAALYECGLAALTHALLRRRSAI